MESSSQSSADAPAQPVFRPRRIVVAVAVKAMAKQHDGPTMGDVIDNPSKLPSEDRPLAAKTTGPTLRDYDEGNAEPDAELRLQLAEAIAKVAAANERAAKQGTPDQARRLQAGARRLRESATKHRVAAAQDRRSVPRVESGLGASRERRAAPTRSRGSRRGTAARSSNSDSDGSGSSDSDDGDPERLRPPSPLCPSNRAVAP